MVLLHFNDFTYLLERVRGITVQEFKKKTKAFTGYRNWLGMKKYEDFFEEGFVLTIYGDIKQPNDTLHMVTYTVTYDEYKRAKDDHDVLFAQLKKQIPNLVDEAFDRVILSGDQQ